MYRKRRVQFKIAWLALAGSCVAQTGQPAGQGSGCASTPAAAIEAARAGQTAASQSTGYRVESVRWDATQRKTWAVIRSCDHAERPTLAMLTDLPRGMVPSPAGAPLAAAAPAVQASSANGTSTVTLAVTPTGTSTGTSAVVHAGEVVRLWRADNQAHIELLATAEENGTLGARVRLRLMTAKDTEGQYAPPKYLAGIVRGPADVEMEQ